MTDEPSWATGQVPLSLIVHRAEQGITDRETMLKLLLVYPYEDGKFVEMDGYAVAYIPSSWDELVQLFLLKRLTQEEFKAIVMANDRQQLPPR